MSGLCRGDWMRLRVGDLVTALEGRHVGRVESINNSARVKVRWLSGRGPEFLYEWFDLDEVEKIEPRHALWAMLV